MCLDSSASVKTLDRILVIDTNRQQWELRGDNFKIITIIFQVCIPLHNLKILCVTLIYAKQAI